MMKYLKAISGLRKRISRNDVCEDIRKFGITVALAGLIGVFVSGDTITAEDGLLLFVTGCIIWVIGLSIRRSQL